MNAIERAEADLDALSAALADATTHVGELDLLQEDILFEAGELERQIQSATDLVGTLTGELEDVKAGHTDAWRLAGAIGDFDRGLVTLRELRDLAKESGA